MFSGYWQIVAKWNVESGKSRSVGVMIAAIVLPTSENQKAYAGKDGDEDEDDEDFYSERKKADKADQRFEQRNYQCDDDQNAADNRRDFDHNSELSTLNSLLRHPSSHRCGFGRRNRRSGGTQLHYSASGRGRSSVSGSALSGTRRGPSI